MKIIPIELQGAVIIETDILQDPRGSFARLFCQEELQELHKNQTIDQINYSFTRKAGTVRGMHFQKPPFSEIKLVRCLKGKIFDVIVDIRKNSPTFLKWHGEELSAENFKMIYIPKGFAHGFQTLEDNSELLYLHNGFYTPEAESGIRYDDRLININWPIKLTEISKRDENFSYLNEQLEGLA